VLLAFDEGPGAGLGHRRRMEALADELRARGVRVALSPLSRGGAMVAARVAVVDSYRVRADDPARVRAGAVVAIDDLGRDLAVDLVVDPSPGATGAPHRRAARVLAGAAYALAAVPPVPAVPAGAAPCDRILVTTGAADAGGIGAAIARGIAAAVPDAEVRLVVGPWGSRTVPAGVVAVHAPDGLAGELAAAPVVVTAGGVALLEACLLGRAIVAVAVAGNQRQAVTGLAEAGAVVASTPQEAPDAARALAADAPRRAALAAAARRALDGKGPARVADAIEELTRA
jgi:spore coat polysaccharide biosynthesis predicted glycosyltransferase SpsG